MFQDKRQIMILFIRGKKLPNQFSSCEKAIGPST